MQNRLRKKPTTSNKLSKVRGSLNPFMDIENSHDHHRQHRQQVMIALFEHSCWCWEEVWARLKANHVHALIVLMEVILPQARSSCRSGTSNPANQCFMIYHDSIERDIRSNLPILTRICWTVLTNVRSSMKLFSILKWIGRRGEGSMNQQEEWVRVITIMIENDLMVRMKMRQNWAVIGGDLTWRMRIRDDVAIGSRGFVDHRLSLWNIDETHLLIGAPQGFVEEGDNDNCEEEWRCIDIKGWNLPSTSRSMNEKFCSRIDEWMWRKAEKRIAVVALKPWKR